MFSAMTGITRACQVLGVAESVDDLEREEHNLAAQSQAALDTNL